MRQMIFYVLMIASCGVFAEAPFPYECKVLPVTGVTVMLPGDGQSLMMIHNLSDVDLWITHPISDPSASAGWSSRLQSNRWSSFALGSHSFELSCIESKPGHEQQVACSGVLSLCQWSNVTTTDKQPPPFWAGENMLLPELLGHLAQRGYKLPEPAKS